MAKKTKSDSYLSAKESRRISRENRKITDKYEKQHKRKKVPESEYLTKMKDSRNVLEVDDLHTFFFTDVGVVKSVDGVTFDVPAGKTIGIVGESGCGKSVTSLSIMQLLQRPQGQIVSGNIRLNLGDKAYEISKTPSVAMQHIRGNSVAMIFQEPMTSLNPIFKIGYQVNEVLELHNKSMTKAEIKARTIELLKMVGIANSEGVYNMYPHELSGGMLQRSMIAAAIVSRPSLLLLDEPTTALDVTIQAQILKLLKKLNRKHKISMLFISHNLNVVRKLCKRVIVMQRGVIVEDGLTYDVFFRPQHPYTQHLIECIPARVKLIARRSMEEGNESEEADQASGEAGKADAAVSDGQAGNTVKAGGEHND